jgi:transposase InsO family protein
MCQVLDVSRPGYYKWRKRRVSDREIKREILLQRIREIFDESRGTYGSPRVYEQLRDEGFTCNHKTVERLMRMDGLVARPRKKFKATTDSNHKLAVSPNLLEQDFTVQVMDEVWVSDLTYVWTTEGWLYLAVFIDLYTRAIVGWSMSQSMCAEIVDDAFRMGVAKRGRPPIVVHSDRGSQYASNLFRETLKDCGTLQSMSRRGNCWDNAVAESFFGALKCESIYRQTFTTRAEAMSAIFDYIEIFYNKRRRHSGIGYMTPEERETQARSLAA